MRVTSGTAGLAVAALALLASPLATQAAEAPKAQPSPAMVGYVNEPLPPGIQVTFNEREGAIFADASGHTLYSWPFRALRLGQVGDHSGRSACTDLKLTETGGFMEPYPPGLILPNVEHRPTCVQAWPPVLAADDAKPVGGWSIITRDDKKKQWAYRGQAVYTSYLDRELGDVLGASKSGGGRHTGRGPVGPAANLPPGFALVSSVTGGMLASEGRSVYVWDKDGANKSRCTGECLEQWKPILAPLLSEARGEFSVFEREPGIKQWAFRGKPVYTYADDPKGGGATFDGAEVPGWRNSYTYQTPSPPKEFKFQDTTTGVVIADHRGKTVYTYGCAEDTEDQLGCDTPDTPQEYRLAICGAGDPARCLTQFPYVPAAKGAKSESRLWNAMLINPMTGRVAPEGQKGAMYVWAFRGRPVYTFAGDREPGDMFAAGWGEIQGSRNGFTALVMQDYFMR